MNQSKRDNYNKRLIHALLVNIHKQLLSNFKQKSNKRHLRADGLSLLPSAIRPRLFNLGLVSLIILSNVVALSLSSTDVSAASLTLIIPASFSLNINPNVSNGFSSTKSSFTVATDNDSGYALTIKARDNNKLKQDNYEINSISDSVAEETFKIDSRFNNSWGYLPSKLNNEDNTDFIAGPSLEDTVLNTTDVANDEANSNNDGDNYDITLAAKVDNTLPSGVYTNSFIISATANAPKYDGIMQEWAKDYSNCENLPENQLIRLLDIRDNGIYKVAKLKDNKCWMVENLRIIDKTIDSSNSDFDSGQWTIPASSIEGFDNSDYDGDWAYYDEAKDSNGDGYGAYYSWHMATAGTGTYSMESGDAKSSICPKGWRLPKGGSSGDFWNLSDMAGYNNVESWVTKPIPGLVYGGYINGLTHSGQITDRSNGGSYWSSTSYDQNRAWDMYFYTDGRMSPGGYNSKYIGFSVRCLVREPEKIMQEVSTWADQLPQVGDTAIAKDIRNDNEYSVARLEDGNLWMTQNLRISNMTLTPEDSSIDTDFTLPASKQEGFNQYNTSYVYEDEAKFGAYYSWYAATAGEGTQDNLGVTAHSICPKGWHLPTLDQIKTLNGKYDLAGAQAAPGNFTFTGADREGVVSDQDVKGLWWSSQADLNNNSGFAALIITKDRFGDSTGDKRYGFPVRCVASNNTTEPLPVDKGDLGNMQSFNCNTQLPDINNYGTVTDVRDNNQYRVARLLDNKCWMIDNLRLGDSKLSNRTLNSTNTDLQSGKTYVLPANGTTGVAYDQGYVIISSYGGFYSWPAATAGTGKKNTAQGVNAESSICPKGWRLPTGMSGGDFYVLARKYGDGTDHATSEALRAFPLPNFLYGGAYLNSKNVYTSGTTGYYWSSTAYGFDGTSWYRANLFNFNANVSNTTGFNYEHYRQCSIRCVSR